MLIYLNDIFDCGGMSVHFFYCLILDVDKSHLAIRFTKNDDFRVFLPVLPVCGDAVGGEIKRV